MSPLLGGRLEDEFIGTVHVYQPHRIGLPPLRTYISQLWQRRHFAFEMSRTNLRAQNYNNAFGMLWLVLNPLLLGLTYFLLIFILGSGRKDGLAFLAHLLGALFAYTFFQQSVLEGASSVTGGGRLLMNSSFPRLLLPLSAVLIGFMKFAPTLVVYAAIHVAADVPTNLNLLWAIPALASLVVFTTGVAMLFATVQVYFRDMRSFLPYLLRITLYLSPILWTVTDLERKPPALQRIIRLSPIFDLIGSWSLALESRRPPTVLLVQGAAWAVGVFVVGALVFVSREREFAVRL